MNILEDTNEGLDWGPDCGDIDNYILVKYSYSATIDNREAAYLLCREQSTSTWNRLHLETETIRRERGAKLFSLNDDFFEVAYPIQNIASQISDLLVTIIGNGSFLNHSIFSRLYVVDIVFPNEFLLGFSGPKYGVGLLDWFGQGKAPLIIGVQKPSIGLDAITHIDRAIDGLRGGCDIIKEDEQLRPSDSQCDFKIRLSRISTLLPRVIRKSQRHMLYVFNVSSDLYLDEYIELISSLASFPKPILGIMLSVSQGLPAIRKIRDKTDLPILLHPSGIGLFTRGSFGISPKVMAMLQRLAGADIIIYPTPFSKISDCSYDQAREVFEGANQDLAHIKQSLVSFGCGVNVNVAKDLYNNFKDEVFSLLVGGAIYGNENGPESGASSFKKNIYKTFCTEARR